MKAEAAAGYWYIHLTSVPASFCLSSTNHDAFHDVWLGGGSVIDAASVCIGDDQGIADVDDDYDDPFDDDGPRDGGGFEAGEVSDDEFWAGHGTCIGERCVWGGSIVHVYGDFVTLAGICECGRARMESARGGMSWTDQSDW